MANVYTQILTWIVGFLINRSFRQLNQAKMKQAPAMFLGFKIILVYIFYKNVLKNDKLYISSHTSPKGND